MILANLFSSHISLFFSFLLFLEVWRINHEISKGAARTELAIYQE